MYNTTTKLSSNTTCWLSVQDMPIFIVPFQDFLPKVVLSLLWVHHAAAWAECTTEYVEGKTPPQTCKGKITARE